VSGLAEIEVGKLFEMKAYMCPKCGRIVYKPPARAYYCKKCSGLFTKVWLVEAPPEVEIPPPPKERPVSPVVKELIERGIIEYESTYDGWDRYRFRRTGSDFYLGVNESQKLFDLASFYFHISKKDLKKLSRVVETLEKHGYTFK